MIEKRSFLIYPITVRLFLMEKRGEKSSPFFHHSISTFNRLYLLRNVLPLLLLFTQCIHSNMSSDAKPFISRLTYEL